MRGSRPLPARSCPGASRRRPFGARRTLPGGWTAAREPPASFSFLEAARRAGARQLGSAARAHRSRVRAAFHRPRLSRARARGPTCCSVREATARLRKAKPEKRGPRCVPPRLLARATAAPRHGHGRSGSRRNGRGWPRAAPERTSSRAASAPSHRHSIARPRIPSSTWRERRAAEE